MPHTRRDAERVVLRKEGDALPRQKRTAFASHRGNMASCSGRGRFGSIVAVIACLQLASLSGVCEAAHGATGLHPSSVIMRDRNMKETESGTTPACGVTRINAVALL